MMLATATIIKIEADESTQDLLHRFKDFAKEWDLGPCLLGGYWVEFHKSIPSGSFHQLVRYDVITPDYEGPNLHFYVEERIYPDKTSERYLLLPKCL